MGNFKLSWPFSDIGGFVGFMLATVAAIAVAKRVPFVKSLL